MQVEEIRWILSGFGMFYNGMVEQYTRGYAPQAGTIAMAAMGLGLLLGHGTDEQMDVTNA